MARWALAIQSVHYTIVHKPGKTMAHADALSRRVYEASEDDTDRADPEAWLHAITLHDNHNSSHPTQQTEVSLPISSGTAAASSTSVGNTDKVKVTAPFTTDTL